LPGGRQEWAAATGCGFLDFVLHRVTSGWSALVSVAEDGSAGDNRCARYSVRISRFCVALRKICCTELAPLVRCWRGFGRGAAHSASRPGHARTQFQYSPRGVGKPGVQEAAGAVSALVGEECGGAALISKPVTVNRPIALSSPAAIIAAVPILQSLHRAPDGGRSILPPANAGRGLRRRQGFRNGGKRFQATLPR